MSGYVKWMDEQSTLVKVIFSIPFLHIFWVIYRIAKSASEKNTLGVVLGVVLLLFVFIPILWVIDIITLIVKDKVLWF